MAKKMGFEEMPYKTGSIFPLWLLCHMFSLLGDMVPKTFVAQKCILIEFPKNTVHFSAVNGRALPAGGLHLAELEEEAPISPA